MKKFTLFINGKKTYFANDEAKAIELAEADLQFIHPNFNLDVSGIKEEE